MNEKEYYIYVTVYTEDYRLQANKKKIENLFAEWNVHYRYLTFSGCSMFWFLSSLDFIDRIVYALDNLYSDTSPFDIKFAKANMDTDTIEKAVDLYLKRDNLGGDSNAE